MRDTNPKKGEIYYYVASNGLTSKDWCNDELSTDIKRYDFYNCFQTCEQAEAEAEKILVRRMLEDIARRLNKGKEINWNNQQQRKIFIYLDVENDSLYYTDCVYDKYQGTIYCLDNSFFDVAIQEIGEERLKKYLKGE